MLSILPFRKKSVRRPARINITPQRMGFPFQQVKPYWFANDPVLTHFLNALSLTFPEGEQFFVDSVRAFRHRVTDSQQQKDISGFIGQEAMHSLEHDAFNQQLMEQGYKAIVLSATEFTKRVLNEGRKNLSPERQLAATVGLEHITAILANRLLSDTKYLEQMDPEVRALWMWHAIEEIEHKSVAYDLYELVHGDYALRVRTLLLLTFYLTSYTTHYTWALLKQDKTHWRPITLGKGLWRLFGPRGFITRTVPDYLQYYLPNFHPWQQDNSELVYQARQQLSLLTEQQKTIA